jgi:hypothetical protein
MHLSAISVDSFWEFLALYLALSASINIAPESAP